jgi:hypothetical protein
MATVGIVSAQWSTALYLMVSGWIRSDEVNIFYVVGITLWSAVVALLLRAAWRGGPVATLVLARLGQSFGVLLTVSAFLVTLADWRWTAKEPRRFLLMLPMLLGGLTFLLVGWLLRRPTVQEWVATRHR